MNRTSVRMKKSTRVWIPPHLTKKPAKKPESLIEPAFTRLQIDRILFIFGGVQIQRLDLRKGRILVRQHALLDPAGHLQFRIDPFRLCCDRPDLLFMFGKALLHVGHDMT